MPDNLALFHNTVYITGPTGVGKTEICLELAQRLDAEILVLDAMTLYRGMDIGTAKASPHDQSLVRHHLIDLLEPTESSDLLTYLAHAQTVLENLAVTGKTALFVGGSPLYLKACLRGLSNLPDRDDAVRQRLTEEAGQMGVVSLHERLATVDPVSAAKIARTDLRRVVRALEIYEVSGGEPPSRLRNKHDRPAPENVPVFALVRDRKSLYDRINRRVDSMFESGLIEEAARLPQPLSHTAAQAVGYTEAFDFLAGKISEAEAREQVRLRTRHYAKHQLTWFRRLEEVRGVSVENIDTQRVVEILLERIDLRKSGKPFESDQIL